ncbi:MAG: Arc family DNA-binding protein [Sphaerochaetaceae bacterium]
MASKDNDKKQIVLRLSPTLWKQVASWAEQDFRSINSQIEYLLTKAVKDHYKIDKEQDEEESSSS